MLNVRFWFFFHLFEFTHGLWNCQVEAFLNYKKAIKIIHMNL